MLVVMGKDGYKLSEQGKLALRRGKKAQSI